jgi:hypothetical protein
MIDPDPDLLALLRTLDPKTRDGFRRVLIRDQADRDAIALRLMRYRDQNGQKWAGRHRRYSHSPADQEGVRATSSARDVPARRDHWF